MSENKGGRPTGYKEEYPEVLFNLMKEGKKGAHLHSHFGITAKCFWEWRKRYPEFNEAYERGWEECEKYWENIGIQMIQEKDDKAFKPWIAFMNRNFGWNKNATGEAGGNTTINVNNLQINNMQTKDELIKFIESELKELNVIEAQFEVKPDLKELENKHESE